MPPPPQYMHIICSAAYAQGGMLVIFNGQKNRWLRKKNQCMVDLFICSLHRPNIGLVFSLYCMENTIGHSRPVFIDTQCAFRRGGASPRSPTKKNGKIRVDLRICGSALQVHHSPFPKILINPRPPFQNLHNYPYHPRTL